MSISTSENNNNSFPPFTRNDIENMATDSSFEKAKIYLLPKVFKSL
ncbi:hypothetical protein [Mariniflexile sp.]